MDEFDESEASDEDVTDDPDPAHLANYLRINPNLLLDHNGGPNPVRTPQGAPENREGLSWKSGSHGKRAVLQIPETDIIRQWDELVKVWTHCSDKEVDDTGDRELNATMKKKRRPSRVSRRILGTAYVSLVLIESSCWIIHSWELTKIEIDGDQGLGSLPLEISRNLLQSCFFY